MSVLTFVSLASSSHGNAYLVSDGETTILLECGLTHKELSKRLGYKLASIDACFVTHEHMDHAKAAKQLIKCGMQLYMSEGTARALELEDALLIEPYKPVSVGHLTVMAFPVWHDAKQPIGFLIDDKRTNERMLFSADTRMLKYSAKKLDYIAVECNYEDALLGFSTRLPESLKTRIRHTHFEIEDVIGWLHRQDLSRVKAVWLLHLSDSNSREAAWVERFQREFPGITFHVCQK